MKEIIVVAMNKESVKMLCEVPIKDKTLTELDVSGMSLGMEGALVVAEYLRDNGPMTSLNLASNDLRADGTKIVAEAIKVTECTPAIILVPCPCLSDFSFNCCCLLISTGQWGDGRPGSCAEWSEWAPLTLVQFSEPTRAAARVPPPPPSAARSGPRFGPGFLALLAGWLFWGPRTGTGAPSGARGMFRSNESTAATREAQGISPQFPGVLVGPPHTPRSQVPSHVTGDLSSIPWGARWTSPRSTFASAIKCHQKSKEHIQLGWIVRWVLSTPPGHPAARRCVRVVPVLPLLLCTRPARARPSIGGQSPTHAPRQRQLPWSPPRGPERTVRFYPRLSVVAH
jgi:hypothetical protein